MSISNLSEGLSSINKQTRVLAKMWRKGNAFALLEGMQTGATTVEISMQIDDQ